jgi:hypothetical protein
MGFLFDPSGKTPADANRYRQIASAMLNSQFSQPAPTSIGSAFGQAFADVGSALSYRRLNDRADAIDPFGKVSRFPAGWFGGGPFLI